MAKKSLIPLFLILPSLIILVATTQIPFIYTLYSSFYYWNLLREIYEFVGLDNYVYAFIEDGVFHQSLLNIAFILITAVSTEIIIALGLAFLLNYSIQRKFKGIGIIRGLLLLPMMMTPIVVGLTFRHMFNAEYGAINDFLWRLGMAKIPWLAEVWTARFAIIVTDVWQWTPFAMLIFLTTLVSLPIEPFEAAEIDGASQWQIIRYLSIPMLKSSILVTLLIRTMDTIKMFDVIYILTKGGPGSSTYVPTFWIYLRAFAHLDIGYAGAMTFLVLIITIAISQVYVRLFMK